MVMGVVGLRVGEGITVVGQHGRIFRVMKLLCVLTVTTFTQIHV